MGFAHILKQIIGRMPRHAKRGTPDDRYLGDAARDRKDWATAAREYRRHVDKYPDDFAILVQLGHMLKEAGELRPASAAYLAAYRLRPEDSDLLLSIGHIAKLRGKFRAAALAYRISFQIDNGADARYELTSPHLKAGLARIERRFASANSSRSLDHMGPLRQQAGAIDHVESWRVSGWAVDREQPYVPARIAFFLNGNLLCEAEAEDIRFDIGSMGYGTAVAGFSIELPIDLGVETPPIVSARLARTGEELSGSPFAVAPPPPLANWLRRKSRLVGAERTMVIDRCNTLTDGLLSIVMPVYNTRSDWLTDAVESVMTQWCDRWELICVDDGSPDHRVRKQLMNYAKKDERVRIVALDTNVGIAAATNAGIAVACGEFVAFMDHDDYLEPDAVFRVLQAVQNDVDFMYSDEAITGDDIHVIRSIAARPSFSHDYYLSHPYFVHLNAARLSVARAIGGWNETMSISADVDFVYRMIEVSRRIAHIPAVLYRWRTHSDSTGHASQDRVTPATLDAMARHLNRLGNGGQASPGYHFNTYRVSYPDDRGATLIVIPTKNAHELIDSCLNSIWETVDAKDDIHIVIIDHESQDPKSIAYLRSLTADSRLSVIPYSGPFNYARMNNVAVRTMPDRFKYVLFMNNDVEAMEIGWLEHLRGLAGRPDVGVVGASLVYGNRTFQHSGVVMGIGDLVDHAHKFVPLMDGERRNLGYNCSLVSTRDYLAVTGACMITRRDLFLGVGGFDEALEIGYNDTDLCLRIGSLGYKILNDAFAVLYHHESITRQRVGSMDHPDDYKRFKTRWGHILISGDPFYNHMLLPRGGEDHRVGELTAARVSPRVRETHPSLAPFMEGTPRAADDRRPHFTRLDRLKVP